MKNNLLREFAYFDRQKIEDFLSTLEDGLIRETKETQKNVGKKLKAEGGLKPLMNVSGEKGYEENELQSLKSSTDASIFQRLYTLLNEQELIKSFDSINKKEWNEIYVGNMLEIRSNIEFSALDILIDNIMNLKEFMELIEPNMDKKTKEAMMGFQMLSHQSSKEGFNIKITPINSTKYKFVAVLPQKNIRSTKQELIGNYTVMCRVQKIIKKNEKFELFKLIPGLKLNRNNIKGFLNTFKDMPPILGKPPKIEDLQISYPAIIITPIAIYR